MLFKKVIRSMLEHKSRYIGSILLLIFSSMMLIMANNTSMNLDITFQSLAEKNVLSDAEFSVNSEINISELSKEYDAVIEQGGTADCKIEQGQVLRVFSTMDAVNITTVSEGKLPGDSEIMVDSIFSEANGYEIEDTIMVSGKEFTISGYCILPNYLYIVESMEVMMNDPQKFGVGVTSKNDFAQLPSKNQIYAIHFNQRENISTQETAVKNALRAADISIISWLSTDQKVNVSYVPMEVGTLQKAGAAVPAIMIILTCLLLGMLMKRMIKGESSMIGTLYAQGYKQGELMRHYLMFPLLVSLIGTVIGAVLGSIGTDYMLGFMMSYFPMPRVATVYSIPLVIAAIIGPVIALCGVTWIIVKRILKKSPAVLMRGDEANDKTNFVERNLKLDKIKFKSKFQIREQVRSISRSFFLLFGIAVATMLILYGLTLKSSTDYMLNEGIKETYNLKYEYVFKTVTQGQPQEGTEPFNAAYVTLKSDDEVGFWISGTLPETQMIVLKDTEGKIIHPKQNTITVPLAKMLDVTIGDSITVIDTANGKEHTIIVEEIADTYVGEFIYMPIDQFNREFQMPADSYLGVWSNEKITFEEGIVAQTKSIDAIIEGFAKLTEQMGPMIYTLFVAAFIVGLIIIYIVTGIVVEESRVTISLMKIFGYKKKEINKMVLNSNTIIVVLGYLLGIPALLGTVGALYESLTDSMQLVLPVKMNFIYIIIGFFVVMVTYIFAKWMSRKKIMRIPMSEALKAGTE